MPLFAPRRPVPTPPAGSLATIVQPTHAEVAKRPQHALRKTKRKKAPTLGNRVSPIALSQVVKLTHADKSFTALDPNKEMKQVKSGAYEGYTLDRFSQKTIPIHGAPDLSPDQDISETRVSVVPQGEIPELGVHAQYHLGGDALQRDLAIDQLMAMLPAQDR